MIALSTVLMSSAHSNTFLICKAPSSGMAGKGGCIHAYNPTADKVCSGKGNKQVCSTASLEDLCIKVGAKSGVPFSQYSSGLGTFNTEKQCLKQCDKEYGGKFEKFGGKCFGMVPK